jgi:RCC1 and BTB domain-containing protein
MSDSDQEDGELLFGVRACAHTFHSVCVLENGEVVSWGWGKHGRLGHDSQQDCFEPMKIRNFGRTAPDGLDRVLRERIRIVEVACGVNHTLLRERTGRIFACGKGSNGRLGCGDQVDHVMPVVIPALTPDKVIVDEIYCGRAYSAVVTADRVLMTFGNGENGQLGMR